MSYKTSQRMSEIDLWKLIYAFLIVALHSMYLPVKADRTFFHGGSIGVEFFFIVSGFFMAHSAGRIKEYDDLAKETKTFLWRKINIFFPYMVFGFCISVVARTLYKDGGIVALIKNCVNGIVELLLLRSSGFGKVFFNGPAWYLSAMILSMAILYPFILKKGKFARQIICPLLSAFILGYLYQKYGHFRAQDTFDVFFVKGMVRGFAEISFGVVCYEIYLWMKKYKFTMLSRIIFTIIEYGSLFAIILYSNTETCWDMDCVSVLLMGMAIIIAASNLSIFSNFWSNLKISKYFGKFSLLLYLNHIYWVWIFAVIGLNMEYEEMFICYMIAAVCSALICWVVVDWVKRFFNKYRKSIYTLFIAEA